MRDREARLEERDRRRDRERLLDLRGDLEDRPAERDARFFFTPGEQDIAAARLSGDRLLDGCFEPQAASSAAAGNFFFICSDGGGGGASSPSCSSLLLSWTGGFSGSISSVTRVIVVFLLCV